MTPPEISFEFFPPQNFEGAYRLWDTVNTLAPLNPRFISVTYGAGGTTRTLTPVSYTHLRAHETRHDLVCRLLLEKKN